MQGVFYNAQWINIIAEPEILHQDNRDSKFASKLPALGILFFPFAILALFIEKNDRSAEGENRYLKRALICATIGIVLWVILLIVLSLISLSILHISI